MSEMTQLSSLVNAQQAYITTLRDKEKSELQEFNSVSKDDYKKDGDDYIAKFNATNDAREVADDARKAVIAAEFGAMEDRAKSLINVEAEVMEYSLAEAAAILATENGQLADAVVAARAATAASYEAAKADFGFADIAALEATLAGISFD